MTISDRITAQTECIRCGACQDRCGFLKKYGINIGDIDALKELAYHCFLCGECSRVCPSDIDGRAVVLNLRREIAKEKGVFAIKAEYKSLVREKSDYRFRNYRHAKPGTAYFPGCNFPSMYPETNARISELLAEQGIGTVYDCCGKPIAELGLEADEVRIVEMLSNRLKDAGITEIITACPNCYMFISGRIDAKVVSIYEYLEEAGIGLEIEGDINVYVPCPDRDSKKWLDDIRGFVRGEVSIVDGPQCCGLGGSACKLEKTLAGSFAPELTAACNDDTRIMVYCASCAGNFRRGGIKGVDHVLTEILGTKETPDTLKSYLNRMLTKVK